MKTNLLLLASMAFSFNAISQTEIEPFAPSVPGTYLGDFEGFTIPSVIPDVSADWTEEGDTGGNDFIADDGATTCYFVGVGDQCFASVENGESITLISPEMDFGSNTMNPEMTFRYRMDDGGGSISFPCAGCYGNSEVEVLYKESSGGSWNVLSTFTIIDNAWHDETIDLSGASSYGTYYLGFLIRTVAPGGFLSPGLASIDEIVVTGESLTCTNTTSAPSVSSCSPYTVPSGDETYTTSGVYNDTIPNAAGCDSIMTIDLTIDNNTSAFTINACDEYTVPSGDETYTMSGVYSDTILNVAGCDSVMTIDLTIDNNTSTFAVNVCDSYTVPSGDETYTTAGIYMDTINNMAGCDSVMTIDVSFDNNTSSFSVDACDSYTVPSGDETYSVSGTVMDTINNVAGCDSVMTITINVVEPDVSISNTAGTLMAGAAGLSYQWIDCSDDSPIVGETGQSFTPTSNGAYAVIVTELGCGDTSDCMTIEGLGVEKNEVSFKFYPNPATDALTIETSLANDVLLQLLTIDGKLIKTINILNPTKYVLDVSALPKGVYVIKLNDSEGNVIQKTLFKQ